MKQIRFCKGIMHVVLLFACFALLAPPAQAQENGKPKEVASVEGITEYKLDNGVRYLFFPDPSAAKVTVNMIVFVGSRHEGYGETGMAHLLEHMLFKGSKLFPAVFKSLEQHGASFNGTTWVDRTNYYETMAASDKNLEFGIKLEADRLVNSFIKREDLFKEMTVVRNEFEIGENSPVTILRQRMMAVAFEWHNYGKSTIGNRSDIERVPIQNLKEFYKKFYQPDNIMVVVAGRFDEMKAHQLIKRYFGAIPRPKRKLPTTYTEEPPQDGERTVVLSRVGTVPVAGVLYHTPAAAHPDSAAIDVLQIALASEPSGRLYKALVETKKATAVGGFAPSWHDPGVLQIMATVGDKSTPEEVRDIMFKVIEDIQKNPVTKTEVDRARRQILASWERAFTNSTRIAIQLAEWAGAGDWRLMFLYRDRIQKITPEQVNAAARKYLVRSNCTVGLFHPTKNIVRAQIPKTPKVEELVQNYKGGKSIAQGEKFDPTPENIEKHVQRKTLPSGLKVALLPKRTRGNSVVARLTLHFGNEATLTGKTTAADFIGPMLTRGTKKYSRQELEDELDKLEATMNIGTGTGSLSVSIQAKRDTLPKVFDLLEETLRHPTFPKKEFDILKAANLQRLKKGLTDPRSLAVNTWRRKTNPYPKDSIHYVPTIPEGIERMENVTLAQVKQIYTDQIGGTKGELVIIGDFDPDTAINKMKNIVAGWNAEVPYRRIERIAKTKVAGSRETILTPDKKNAIYLAGYQMKIKDTAPQYPALELANYALGGSGLNSVLFGRLRGKEGLSYGAGTQFSAAALDEYGVFLAYALFNPNAVEKVDGITLEVLQQMLKKGISDKQLNDYRESYLRQQKVTRANDSTLAAMLREGLYLNRTMKYYADLENQIAKLSVSDVNRALRQLIDVRRLVIVRAGDFKKSKSKNSNGR